MAATTSGPTRAPAGVLGGLRRRARRARDRVQTAVADRLPEAGPPGPGLPGPRELGMTLVELLVAIGIFSVVVAITMQAIVVMTRATVRADVLTGASDEVRVAFQRMDHQVRYAEAINKPGTGASGSVYVEFRVGATVSATGTAQCTQWRWDPTAQTLARRSWTDQASPAVPDWSVVADRVLAPTTASAAYPFKTDLATAAQPHQQLSLTLVVGSRAANETVETTSTFTARNSGITSVTNDADLDGDGQTDTPVCVSAVGRP